MNRSIFLLCTLVSALLAGCGGGGGGSSAPAGPVTSTLSFPFQSAYSALVAGGYTKSYTVSGTCSGTANETAGAASSGATFEGVNGRLSVTGTLTISLTNCTPASIASTSTTYYDSNYIPLGTNTVGGNYSVFLTPPSLPTSVLVGSTGVVGTITRYTNSTKSTAAGRGDYSYVVEADTASTAIINLIDKEYNASSTLTGTQQSRYRIAATGALVPVSIDVQYANGSTTHLVFQ